MTNTHLKSVFRWEDAASLEHACWACPTKANSPRALQTCYGIHSMPCASYHPTMHAIGAAHRCSGCAVARAMHDARHREIAELVSEYHSVNAATNSTETPKKSHVLGERSINIPFRPRQSQNVCRELKVKPLPLQYGHNTAVDDSGIEMDSNSGIENDNASSVDFEDDTISTVSSIPSHPTTPLTPNTARKPSAAEKRATKKARKSAHSQSKAIKNQHRNIVSVTSADVERVAVILHGEGDCLTGVDDDGGRRRMESHPLAEDRGIEDVIARNLKFVKAIQAHKAYLRGVVAKGRKESRQRRKKFERSDGEEAEVEEIVDVVLVKLGVRGAGGVGVGESVLAKGRKGSGGDAAGVIVAKLRTLIKQDLEKHENEVQQMYIRAGGFWRYVGRTVFERMTAVAEGMDVRSGEKNLTRARHESAADLEGKQE